MKKVLLAGCIVVSLWSCQSKSEPSAKTTKQPKQYAVLAENNLDSAEIDKYHDALEGYLNATLLRFGHFNGGILVAKNGTIVYERYVGYKDFKTKEPLTNTSSLQIASTSKTFTAMAVLKLVQEGKLKLSTTLEEIFPGFPYPGITVKMLLNHRSGLPNYLYYLEKGGWDKKTFLTNNDVLQTLMTLKPPKSANPDRRFQYCNTNYVLLALVVEKISGQPFPQYMQAEIFDPLQMKNTYIYTVGDTARATPSYNAGRGVWQMDYTDGPYGDKNVYSTPRDLLKWDRAIASKSIVNPALMDSAFAPYSNERPSIHNYGLGWRLLMLKNGKKVTYHNGRWHGFNSAFARLTDENATIIILGNKYNSAIYSTARKLYNFFGPYDETGSMQPLEETGNKE